MAQLEFEDLLSADRYVSVSQLTRDIKSLLETAFPSVWVQGEISNLKHHSSGHLYFSLKDKDAQISCVMWRSRNQELFFAPADGMRVLAKSRLSLYEKRGAYQLDVWQMQLAGAGELQLAFERLKHRLFEEGLFDEDGKRPLPPFPERIGIVTSASGAAIRDLQTVLQRRFPPIEIILNPVRVQGEGAAAEIAKAIDAFNQYGAVDVLVVARGGGSIEDLWAFNEEIVARAIRRCNIPVVSAVGHEVDFTISDFVADVRAATPSAAGETIVRRKEDISAQLRYFVENMSAILLERIKLERERVQAIERSYAFRTPLDMVAQLRQQLDDTRETLDRVITHKFALNREVVTGLSKRLSSLNHQKLLVRGYSLCCRRSDGLLINSAGMLDKKDDINITFHRGNVHAKVSEVFQTSGGDKSGNASQDT